MKRKLSSGEVAPIVILVRPQLAQNVGMVARAMMNCGLSELRLVSPKQSHLVSEAVSAASGAQSILEDAKLYSSLSEALADVKYSFATTARVRDMIKPVYSPQKASLKINTFLQSGQKTAFIFGPERTGLENEDIILSNALLTVDLNPVHPSLNLAQAVLLVGWSWWQTQDKVLKKKMGPLASQKELDNFLIYLEKMLDKKGYFQWPDKKQRMIYNMRNIFMRDELTTSEIKTLYRIVKTLTGIKN